MYAHSRNGLGQRHALVDHLAETARLTAEFADGLGARDVGYYLGLWHDVGKFDPDWQDYLLNAEAGLIAAGHGPDHKAAGTSLAARSLGPLAHVIQGHHGGLKSGSELRGWLPDRASKPGVGEALRLARAIIPTLDPPGQLPLPSHLARPGLPRDVAPRSAEFFIRLMFSALVDADSLAAITPPPPASPSPRADTLGAG